MSHPWLTAPVEQRTQSLARQLCGGTKSMPLCTAGNCRRWLATNGLRVGQTRKTLLQCYLQELNLISQSPESEIATSLLVAACGA